MENERRRSAGQQEPALAELRLGERGLTGSRSGASLGWGGVVAVASFTVPSLLWGLRLAPKPAPKTADDGGPWAFATVHDTEDVEELLRTLDPLIRGLTLAGYDVQGVAFAVFPGGASAGEDPIDWVFVEDLRTMHVLSQPGGWFDTVGLSAPAGAEALVALLMHSREMYAGRGPLYGVPLPVTGATFPFDEVPAPDPDSGDDPPPWRHAVSSIAEGGVVSTLQIALARQEPDAQVPPLEEILAGLAGSQGYLLETIELDFMQGADQFAQFTSQEEPHGLLGMFDPSTWSFARERWAPGGVDTIHAFGQDLWGAILDDARIGLHPFVHGELFTQLPLREAIRRARGQAVGGWAMVRAFGDAVVARVTATGGELEPAVEDFIADLAKSSWTDALMAAHSLEVVDVLGYAPLVAFDETPAKRDQYDVTGFYESFALHRVATALPPPEELQTVQLNQAGELLTGYWQTRALDTNGRLQHIIGHRVVATRVAGLSGQYRFERTLLDPVSAGAQPDTIRGNATGTLTFVDAKLDGLPDDPAGDRLRRRRETGRRRSSLLPRQAGSASEPLGPGEPAEGHAASRRVRPAPTAPLGRALVLERRHRPADRRHAHVPLARPGLGQDHPGGPGRSVVLADRGHLLEVLRLRQGRRGQRPGDDAEGPGGRVARLAEAGDRRGHANGFHLAERDAPRPSAQSR